MRAKRSKKYRKTMSSYNLHFSFRTPYQVLCTQTFLRQCHAFSMPVPKSLANTLHGDARPYITQCSLAAAIAEHKAKTKGSETNGRGRGDGKPLWLPPPTEVPLRYCKHKDAEGKEVGVISEAECLVDLIGGTVRGNETARNKNHYVLADADVGDVDVKPKLRLGQKRRDSAKVEESRKRKRDTVDVREAARLVPGVPIVYVKRSVMILEEMSAASERVIRGLEREKFKEGLVGDARGVKRKRTDGEADSDDDDVPVRTLARPVVKKAKGANPLSVRKKKARPVNEGEGGAVGADNTEDGGNEDQKKKRRKRRHGGTKSSGTGNDGQPDAATVRPSSAIEG